MHHSRRFDLLFWRTSWRKWMLCCKHSKKRELKKHPQKFQVWLESIRFLSVINPLEALKDTLKLSHCCMSECLAYKTQKFILGNASSSWKPPRIEPIYLICLSKYAIIIINLMKMTNTSHIKNQSDKSTTKYTLSFFCTSTIS